MIYEDPLFIAYDILDFNLMEDSPCIDAGNPGDNDFDNSIRDIGAKIFNQTILGDCSQDNQLDILDVIFIINNCILDSDEACENCSDMDQNEMINILDIILIINIILENN